MRVRSSYCRGSCSHRSCSVASPRAASFSATLGPQPGSTVSGVSPVADSAGAGRFVRLAKDQDGVDLEGGTLRQAGDLDGGARRVRGLEVLGHDLVDLREL